MWSIFLFLLYKCYIQGNKTWLKLSNLNNILIVTDYRFELEVKNITVKEIFKFQLSCLFSICLHMSTQAIKTFSFFPKYFLGRCPLFRTSINFLKCTICIYGKWPILSAAAFLLLLPLFIGGWIICCCCSCCCCCCCS